MTSDRVNSARALVKKMPRIRTPRYRGSSETMRRFEQLEGKFAELREMLFDVYGLVLEDRTRIEKLEGRRRSRRGSRGGRRK